MAGVFRNGTSSTNLKLLDYIKSKDLKRAVMLLVDGADPNIKDPITGNTALHLAVKVSKASLARTFVRLLLVFDANPKERNRQFETPLEVAHRLGATLCASDMETLIVLRNKLAADKPRGRAMKEPPSTSDENIFMLSLDGGGIRGLVFMQVLIELDKRCQQLYPGSKPIHTYFNWITGNSSGGLAALYLTATKGTLQQARRLYFIVKDEVVRGPPPYPNKQVDAVMQRTFGSTNTMADIKEPNVCVMTAIANQAPPKLHIMSNYGGSRDDQLPPEKRLVWEAARSTTAAVPFFHPFDKKFIDGGIIANNPTVDTIVDITEYSKREKQQRSIKLVLSLSTGESPPEEICDIDFEEVNPITKAFNKALSSVSSKAGSAAEQAAVLTHNPTEAVALKKLILKQVTQPSGQVVKRSKVICELIGAEFHRINPEIMAVSFQETDDGKLIDMMWMALVSVLKSHATEMDFFLDSLMQMLP